MSPVSTLTVVQVRSAAGRDKRVKATLSALGLGTVGKRSSLPANPAVAGMVRKVSHLVTVAAGEAGS